MRHVIKYICEMENISILLDCTLFLSKIKRISTKQQKQHDLKKYNNNK